MDDQKLAVDVRTLVKVYGKDFKALQGIDLKIKSGDVFAILGPNGAGKTTLMRILTTQLKPTSGEAYVADLDTTKKDSEIRKIIGYVPQEMSVWTDITGYENLLIYSKIYGIPEKERDNSIKVALEEMGLTQVANNLVGTYSGGMVRRLEITCAMLIKPQILFLDEPTIGLDPSARKVVWEKLSSYSKDYGTTIIFNTHYMNEADDYANGIALIIDGKIVKLGTAQELKKSIGGEIVKLTLSDKINESSLETIKKLNFVKDVIVNENEIDVIVDNADMNSSKIIKALTHDGLSITKISIEKPTLDDVFLKYAGTKLESRGRAVDIRQFRKMIKGV